MKIKLSKKDLKVGEIFSSGIDNKYLITYIDIKSNVVHFKGLQTNKISWSTLNVINIPHLLAENYCNDPFNGVYMEYDGNNRVSDKFYKLFVFN